MNPLLPVARRYARFFVTPLVTTLVPTLLAAGLTGLASQAMAQYAAPENPCGSLKNAYGPFDYRTRRDMLGIVEDAHFNQAAEMLVRPMGRHFGGDFDYTLRASPNHHRALVSLSRYAEKVKLTQIPDARYTVDCYFDRAMRFATDDLIVRMIYAGHLIRTKREADALVHLDYVAQKAAPDNPFTHYNLGLLYVEIKRYDKALPQAHAAMKLGLPRTELRDALKKAGKWTEPQADAPAEAASAASPAS